MTDNTPLKKIHQNIILNNSYAGKRIDSVITDLLPDFSRSQIQKWIKDGNIKINGTIQKNKYIVLGYETLDINVELTPQNEWIAENIKLDIVYEDEDIIIINKHAGIVVHPGAGNSTGTISNALLHHNKESENIPRAGIVHRLDKDTTGLMVAAKSILAYNSLIEQLSNRTVNRKYLAIVEGLLESSGTIDKPIGRSSSNRTKMAITENGKEAITNYTPIELFTYHTLVECKLETGRTHQIRVHMKSIGYPLVGDQTYNNKSKRYPKLDNHTNNALSNLNRQALHAFKLSFIHPKSKEIMNFTQHPPLDMLKLINILRQN
ncbi:23S rRNA pseudouridine(1911/1915/1917) synthase RluD [Francisella frigiditurris]|uniref:Pseudouridine synthase n=1 Tax=Francisella frigiditurris TaxID=1542390 RepID=A0A1J0KRJ3_9GAMM|nr:23S rRNA pseudouridine(1911/1915/1917) synthase RluD [Francisella frigiditurris]APC96327.1 pseudouridine synthase, RluA family protein [Francisella frigiditurris]